MKKRLVSDLNDYILYYSHKSYIDYIESIDQNARNIEDMIFEACSKIDNWDERSYIPAPIYLLEEFEYITSIQSDIQHGLNIRSHKFDEEITYYELCYHWNEIDSNEKIETVYWADEFSNFINYIKKNQMSYMVDLFKVDFSKLKITKGFNYISVNKILEIFKYWCKKNHNVQNILEDDHSAGTFEFDEAVESILEEFFI